MNPFERIQKELKTHDLFPKIEGYCACGCGEILLGQKKKWFSDICSTNAYIHTAILKGNTSVIRWQLFQKDKGACRNCGEITKNWHADHIFPVFRGGGACGLDNFQTLCVDCHKEKTRKDLSETGIPASADYQ